MIEVMPTMPTPGVLQGWAPRRLGGLRDQRLAKVLTLLQAERGRLMRLEYQCLLGRQVGGGRGVGHRVYHCPPAHRTSRLSEPGHTVLWVRFCTAG